MNVYNFREINQKKINILNDKLSFSGKVVKTASGLILPKRNGFHHMYLLYVASMMNFDREKNPYFIYSSELYSSYLNLSPARVRGYFHQGSLREKGILLSNYDEYEKDTKIVRKRYLIDEKLMRKELKKYVTKKQFRFLLKNKTMQTIYDSILVHNELVYKPKIYRKRYNEFRTTENYEKYGYLNYTYISAYHYEKFKKQIRKLKKDKQSHKKTIAFRNEFQEFNILKKEIDTENHFKFLDEFHQRLTSPFVATRKTSNPISTRLKEVSEYLGINKFYVKENDLNGEAFRNAYAIGNGKVLSLEKDIYQVIYEQMQFTKEDLLADVDVSIFTLEIREVVKTLIMSVFTTPYQLKNRINVFKLTTSKSKAIKKKILEFYRLQKIALPKDKHYQAALRTEFKEVDSYFSRSEMKLMEIGRYVEEVVKIKFISFITEFTRVVENFFNWNDKNYALRTLFNAHSSNIQLLVLQAFKERGIKVTTVYDCFYYDKRKLTDEEFNNIYLEAQQLYIDILEANHTEYLSLIRR